MADERILALGAAPPRDGRWSRGTVFTAAVLTALALSAAAPALAKQSRLRASSLARRLTLATQGDRRTISLAGTSPAHLQMSASLAPERLGRASTIAVGFEIADPPGEYPQPLTGMTISLPAGLSVSTSELGLADCEAAPLEGEGPGACPRDSEIGHGSAVAEVPFGAQLFAEKVAITLYSAPLRDKRAQLLVYASGEHPVIANIVFAGSIAPASHPFGARIETPMPLVPGLPGGPDVALVSIRTTIGSAGILYTERAHGKMIRFHPKGLVLPRRCPRGGFPFSATVYFENGTAATGVTDVSCPTVAPKRPRLAAQSRRR